MATMNKNQTKAERIAALAGNDGKAFPAEFIEACRHARWIDWKGDLVRYEFADGSAIVEAPGAWDIEGSSPWSWVGAE